uniref:Bifunctional inhibitor/plant lipid transfer protein/seed storage helical domain-containing protein n=1 Tax=Rhizophora mucronata TaxID=61149 RepID=A0A2P2JA86_RHIMU
MASSMMLSLLVVMAVAFFVGSTTLTSAQNIPSCATKLIPCSDYLNSTTKPPSSCCNPVKEAVDKELPCLCNLYKNPGLLSSFGVNVTQALQISQRCGVKADLSVCNKGN